MLKIVDSSPTPGNPGVPELEHIARLSTTPVFNIKAVEQTTDVLASTLRAWERRYGIVVPQRTESGYRLYSERDVALIRWLKLMLAEGMTIKHAATLLTARLAATESRPSPVYQTDELPLVALRSGLRAALLKLDEAAANHLLADAFSLFPVESVCLQLLAPILVEIGNGWFTGEVTIAQEHFASHWVRQKVLGLMAAIPPPRTTGRPIITAAAPSDQHELGVLFVALFLQRAGWEVIHLGANLAAEGLSETLTLLRPALIAIAATHLDAARRIPEIAREIELMSEPRPILGFGGQIFNQDADLREQTPGVFLGQDAAEVVASVQRLVRPPLR